MFTVIVLLYSYRIGLISFIVNVHPLEMMSQQVLDYVMDHFDMSCDQCNAMFESFADAKRHYLREHSEPKGYIKCCGKKMRTLTIIEEHIQGHKNPQSLK